MKDVTKLRMKGVIHIKEAVMIIELHDISIKFIIIIISSNCFACTASKYLDAISKSKIIKTKRVRYFQKIQKIVKRATQNP